MASLRPRKKVIPLNSKLKQYPETSVSSSHLLKIGQINRTSRSLSVSKYRNLISNSIGKAKQKEPQFPIKKTGPSNSRRSPEIFDSSLEYDRLEKLTNRYETARSELLLVQQKVLEFGLRDKLNGKGLYEVSEENEVSFSKLDKSFDELVGRCFQGHQGLPRLPRGSKPV